MTFYAICTFCIGAHCSTYGTRIIVICLQVSQYTSMFTKMMIWSLGKCKREKMKRGHGDRLRLTLGKKTMLSKYNWSQNYEYWLYTSKLKWNIYSKTVQLKYYMPWQNQPNPPGKILIKKNWYWILHKIPYNELSFFFFISIHGTNDRQALASTFHD